MLLMWDTGEDTYPTVVRACEYTGQCVLKNGETARLWKKEFESLGGMLRLSQWGRYVRDWIMNEPVKRQRGKRWLRYNVRRRPKIKDKKG